MLGLLLDFALLFRPFSRPPPLPFPFRLGEPVVGAGSPTKFQGPFAPALAPPLSILFYSPSPGRQEGREASVAVGGCLTKARATDQKEL